MVNIQQINELTQSVKSQGGASGKSESTDAFKNALTQALDKENTTQATGANPSSGLGEITATQSIHLDTQSDIVSGATDELLGLLDTYSAQLGNPSVSLKQMEPVVDQMSKNSGKLLEEAASLGEDDAALKEIAREAAVTAQTEYIKFYRGDYLS